MRINVISTDVSKFPETGFGSIESCRNVYKAVKKKYPDTYLNIVHSEACLNKVVESNPDIVILGFKYLSKNDEKLWLSKFFEDHDINFVGSPYSILEYDSNKIKAKQKVKQKGLETPDFFMISPEKGHEEKTVPLDYPLFVKPVDAACSFGVDEKSLVGNFEKLSEKAKDIKRKFDQNSLVEDYLPGKEYTVAMIGNGAELEVAPVRFHVDNADLNRSILTHEIKVANIEQSIFIDDKQEYDSIVNFAKKIFHILNVRDFCRIDIKLDKFNNPNFLEINLVPGLTKGRSYFPIAFERNMGLSYDETVLKTFEAALDRIHPSGY